MKKRGINEKRRKNGKHSSIVSNRRRFDARRGGWDGFTEVDVMCRITRKIVEFGRFIAIGKTKSLIRH